MTQGSALYSGPTAKDLATIPHELKARRQWVLWRGADRIDRKTGEITGLEKIPINPQTRRGASTTDPTTWGSFEQCVAALPEALEEWEHDNPSAYRGGGIGYVFSRDDPYVGIDLDHCVDLETLDIAEQAKAYNRALWSYTEQSPSGTGLHILVKGTLPSEGHKKNGVEMYDSGRFFTITGWHVPGTPRTIEARQDELTAFHAAIFAPPQTPHQHGPKPQATSTALLDDSTLLDKARMAANGDKFTRLYDAGNTTEYGSQSEADLALCSLLAFWTQDTAQIDQLFRQSGLMRGKWDEKHGAQTYGAGTIAKALSRQTEHYTPVGDAHQHRNGHKDAVSQATEPLEDEPAPVIIPWPTMAPDAFYGLAGAIVRTIAPHTESDPVALLVQLLAMVGNCIGRIPYYLVEATRHYVNIFAVLVGKSSKARKGTSADHIKLLLRGIDPAWSTRVVGGMSSGEGIIWQVRDAVYGRNKAGEEVCLDDGVEDKRLCTLETEFARGLAKTGQEGNVLSAVLRQAWDHGDLRTLVSGRHKAPVVASNAHVSICAHITADEVRRLLTDTEAANGFGNRFLWVCVQRSKLLPRGGRYPETALKPLREQLQGTILHARQVTHMQRTEEAEKRWETIYTALAEEQSGLLGAITARAEAQVLRLSCLYALLDKTAMVDVGHLTAAYALWRYCEDSARHIFGDMLGDPLADELRRMLHQAGQEGLTRTDINNALGRHVKSAVIGQALARLQRDGFARMSLHKTAGRSVETWHAITHSVNAQSELSELSEKSVTPSDHNSLNSLFSYTQMNDVGYEEGMI